MARIRTIKPEFPQSESMGRVSRDARLLFIMLWTIADDFGRARANSRMLASLLFPYDDDAPIKIPEWLMELERQKCVRVYAVEGNAYLQIEKWSEHQKVDNPGKSRFPEPPILAKVSKKLSRKSEDLSRKPEKIALDQGPRTKDQGSGTKDLSMSGEPDPSFDDFWRDYPKDPNMSKKQARAEWDKLSPEGRAQAVAAIPAFKTWIKTQKDYRVLHACRFLSQKRFEGFGAPEVRYSEEEIAEMKDRADRLLHRGKYAEEAA